MSLDDIFNQRVNIHKRNNNNTRYVSTQNPALFVGNAIVFKIVDRRQKKSETREAKWCAFIGFLEQHKHYAKGGKRQELQVNFFFLIKTYNSCYFMDNNNNYSAKDIKVLKGLDPVRKRPGMYIGSTGISGLHHLIWEVLDNSIDEYSAGYANIIKININSDISQVTVEDNGRGIPVDVIPG